MLALSFAKLARTVGSALATRAFRLVNADERFSCSCCVDTLSARVTSSTSLTIFFSSSRRCSSALSVTPNDSKIDSIELIAQQKTRFSSHDERSGVCSTKSCRNGDRCRRLDRFDIDWLVGGTSTCFETFGCVCCFGDFRTTQHSSLTHALRKRRRCRTQLKSPHEQRLGRSSLLSSVLGVLALSSSTKNAAPNKTMTTAPTPISLSTPHADEATTRVSSSPSTTATTTTTTTSSTTTTTTTTTPVTSSASSRSRMLARLTGGRLSAGP